MSSSQVCISALCTRGGLTASATFLDSSPHSTAVCRALCKAVWWCLTVWALRGAEITSTDAEACAYLNTASLTRPMGHDWAQIYLYVANQVYRRWNNKNEFPKDIRVESLRDDQMGDLNGLKAWIYQQRIKARLDQGRAERRQKREDEAEKKRAEQPALFEF